LACFYTLAHTTLASVKTDRQETRKLTARLTQGIQSSAVCLSSHLIAAPWRVWQVIGPALPFSRLVLVQQCPSTTSIFTCCALPPTINLQANSLACKRNGGVPPVPSCYLQLDLPKHVMRNVSMFCLASTLSQWHCLFGEAEIDIV